MHISPHSLLAVCAVGVPKKYLVFVSSPGCVNRETRKVARAEPVKTFPGQSATAGICAQVQDGGRRRVSSMPRMLPWEVLHTFRVIWVGSRLGRINDPHIYFKVASDGISKHNCLWSLYTEHYSSVGGKATSMREVKAKKKWQLGSSQQDRYHCGEQKSIPECWTHKSIHLDGLQKRMTTVGFSGIRG